MAVRSAQRVLALCTDHEVNEVSLRHATRQNQNSRPIMVPALTTSTNLQYTLMQSFADHENNNHELSTLLPAEC